MRTRDRPPFRTTIALEFRPDAREAGERPIVIDGEPDHVFFLGFGVRLRRIFSKAVERHEATVFRLQPSAPMRDDVLRIFVTGGPPVRSGGGMAQRIKTSSRSWPAFRMTGAG